MPGRSPDDARNNQNCSVLYLASRIPASVEGDSPAAITLHHAMHGRRGAPLLYWHCADSQRVTVLARTVAVAVVQHTGEAADEICECDQLCAAEHRPAVHP